MSFVAAARSQTAMIECPNVRIRARHCEAVTSPLCPRPYQRRAVGLLRRASAFAHLGKLPSIYPCKGIYGQVGQVTQNGISVCSAFGGSNGSSSCFGNSTGLRMNLGCVCPFFIVSGSCKIINRLAIATLILSSKAGLFFTQPLFLKMVFICSFVAGHSISSRPSESQRLMFSGVSFSLGTAFSCSGIPHPVIGNIWNFQSGTSRPRAFSCLTVKVAKPVVSFFSFDVLKMSVTFLSKILPRCPTSLSPPGF